jgi:hypothetical protein
MVRPRRKERFAALDPFGLAAILADLRPASPAATISAAPAATQGAAAIPLS